MSKLPIHGFVLAGGLSSRMGTDKTMLEFRGSPMIAIALETLAATCERVSIAGNRSDLATYGNVVPDRLAGEGPAAGIDAGILVCESEWAMFMPVDLPLLPPEFVRKWAQAVLSRPGTRVSYSAVGSDAHPALCLIRKDCAAELVGAIAGGNRRLKSLLDSLEGLWVADVSDLADGGDSDGWFANMNTPDDLLKAQVDLSGPSDHNLS